ncbi:2-keto-4-pentenoate hydratase [Devosia sp. CN2-171]|uniref:2-keto-4-pentenoate hydratase n=1 Tax=Devosia sp. CN2-171 TaxID=3400909 RepID=UPI003BF8578A
MLLQTDVDRIAAELADLWRAGRERQRLTDEYQLDLPTAYRVAKVVRERKAEGGDRWIGRKIGFTNHHMWEVYDVKAPFWAAMYESSVQDNDGTLKVNGFPNPKIEPEVIFGLSAAPAAGMNERDLLGCINWVALGFELVSSIYPNWKFQAPDAVAGFGLHALLAIGERVAVSSRADWIDRLAAFRLQLWRNRVLSTEGGGLDVLGSPLTALRHLNDVVNDPAFGPPLAAGEIITTGTLTLAMSVSPGETWTARATGIDLPGISVVTE